MIKILSVIVLSFSSTLVTSPKTQEKQAFPYSFKLMNSPLISESKERKKNCHDVIADIIIIIIKGLHCGDRFRYLLAINIKM
jgi:hypothetical protein